MPINQFLKPRSVEEPYEGAFTYTPFIRVFDEASPALLEAAMNTFMTIQEVDLTNFWVIERIDYETYVTVPPMPLNRFTALVHATRVNIR